MLRPGGVVLLTASGVSQISPADMRRWGDYWRFTDASLGRLLEDSFGGGLYSVRPFGNVLAACAFLQGVALEELTAEELDDSDPEYQVVIGARAQRA